MKIFLLILLIVFILVGSVLGFLLLQFNGETTRHYFIKKLSELTAADVQIESVALGWHEGLSLEIRNLALSEKSAGNPAQPTIAVQKAMAYLDVWALFRQNLRLGTITLLNPQIRAVRTSQGEILLPGVFPFPKKQTEVTTSAVPGSISFFIDRVAVRNASVEFTDQSQNPPRHFILDELDLQIHPIALTTPIRLEASGRFFGTAKNFDAKAEVLIPLPGRAGTLRNFQARLDLDRTDLAAAFSFSPASPIGGQVIFEIPIIPFEKGKNADIEASIRLKNGSFPAPGWKEPLKNIELQGLLKGDTLSLEIPSVQWAGGRFSFKSQTIGIGRTPETKANAGWKDIRLETFQQASDKSTARFEGTSSGAADISFRGFSNSALQTTLAGSGTFEIISPKLRNLNLLNEVFGKLSVIPGVSQKLQSRLPEDYLEKFRSQDTFFQDIRQSFRLEQGRVWIPQISVMSDTMAVVGNASISLPEGMLTAATTVILDPYLSNALIKSLNELSVLTDSKNQLHIPVRIEGPPGRVTVLPDLQYIATKIAAAKLSSTLENAIIGKRNSGTGTTSTAQDPKAVLLNSLIGSFLQEASARKENSQN